MNSPNDLNAWLDRGDALACFGTRVDQAMYLRAYEMAEVEYVVIELERIFTVVHRLPVLNWLINPAAVRFLDFLEDAPPGIMEDWRPSDFAIRLPQGTYGSPDSFDQVGGWEGLLAGFVRDFLFLTKGDKAESLRVIWDAVRYADCIRPMPLSLIVSAATSADFIASSAGKSDTLQAYLPRWEELPAIALRLRERATALINARELSVGAPAGTTRLITLHSLRSCQTIFDVRNLLIDADVPTTHNLMSYLRCEDI